LTWAWYTKSLFPTWSCSWTPSN